jgi:hypothetical protein
VLDMVVHGGKVQREGEQVCVSCTHGMDDLVNIGDDPVYLSLSLVLGRVWRGQRGTSADLGSMGEAMVHWFL